MAAEATTPVSTIDGIGPAIEAGLARLGIFVVFDLLRAASEHLHSVVRSDASLANVESWRIKTALLQVQAVTPAWAAALVRAGVLSVDGLDHEERKRNRHRLHSGHGARPEKEADSQRDRQAWDCPDDN